AALPEGRGPEGPPPVVRWAIGGRTPGCLPPLADVYLVAAEDGEALVAGRAPGGTATSGAGAAGVAVRLLLVELAPGLAAPSVGDELRDRLGARAWYGRDRAGALAASAQAATAGPERLSLAAVLAAAAAAVVQAALVLYYARRRRLGALAAAGADGRDLARIFAGEVAAAALGGWAAGMAAASAWAAFGSPPGGSAVVLGAALAALGVGLAVAVGVRGPGRELGRASPLELLFERGGG
ncbi:MAG: hypothetical protein IRZ11_07800, partial [Clostridia bacterium]|nr:hypothetical protein [Clostridia bacterium]